MVGEGFGVARPGAAGQGKVWLGIGKHTPICRKADGRSLARQGGAGRGLAWQGITRGKELTPKIFGSGKLGKYI